MPTVSMFYGIKIYLYTSEHNPPHFHAEYQDFEALYDFDGNRIEGSMPRKQERLISAWTELHGDELLANWDIAQSGERPYRIEPLR